MVVIQSIAKSVRKRGNTYIRTVYPGAFAGAVVLRVWLFLDVMVSWYLNSKPLRQDRITTINVRLRRRRGGPVKLDDGSVVNPMDLILELHLNNN